MNWTKSNIIDNVRPYLLVNVFYGQIQTHDLVVDQELHSVVVLQKGHELAVLTNFVFHVSHQGTQARFHAGVRIPEHATLQEVLLLRIFFQSEEELANVVFLGVNRGTKTFEYENGGEYVLEAAFFDGFYADRHKGHRFFLSTCKERTMSTHAI